VDNRINIIHEHFRPVVKRYPGLKLAEGKNGCWLVKGELYFYASYNNVPIEDEFDILIFIPKDFPDKPPRVMETGKRIPINFHHYKNDILCLGTPLEINLKFKKNPTLLGFIEEQLITYLYGFSYQERNGGKMPFGEWPHAGEGIVTFYRGLFNIEEIDSIMGLLRIMADNLYRGHHDCPCGSGQKLRHCHGNQLRELIKIQDAKDFLIEYKHAYEYCEQLGIQISRSNKSKRHLKLLNKNLKEDSDLLIKRKLN
jgi:hypothetical protein